MNHLRYGFCSFLSLAFLVQVYGLNTVYLDEHCGNTVPILSSTRIKASRFSTLTRNLNCIVKTNSVNGENIVAVFRNYNTIRGSAGKCTRNRLDIFHGATTDPATRMTGSDGVCGIIYKDLQFATNSSQYMTLQFSTDSTIQSGSFDIIFTSYHYGPCVSGEFACNNKRCIDDSLICDGYNHCGDNSGQLSCAVVLTVGVIIAIVLACLVFVVCLPVIVVVYICKRLSYSRF